MPANLLRIELRADHALSGPLDLKRVHLFDADGREIVGAFLGLALPDRDGRNVDVLMHPGRIKTGVGPNLALGPALHAGQRVTLRIDDPQLGPPMMRHWIVTGDLRQRVDLAGWTLQTPAAGTRKPLIVGFVAPMSRRARTMIAVADEHGVRIHGLVELSGDELQWRFVPTRPWSAGRYVLRVHPDLEDVAGNRVCARFEQAALHGVVCNADGRRPFSIANAAPGRG
ncbi:MAG: hypothetical protein ABI702_22540 [Burkholderiales bacterium]